MEEKDPAYFGYYAQFIHQQNMLQDVARTSAYQNAILMNRNKHFEGKLVMDVGAGSGAAQVYAIEASSMAQKIQKMLDSSDTKNGWLRDKIQVVQSKIEKPLKIPKVDTIISEPIGVLLVHERMIESFLHARDNYLKPNGCLIPSSGTIFLAPFSDAGLWTQTNAKVRFWEQTNFYGVDFSPLSKDAKEEIFGQPVVGHFDHRILMAPSSSFMIDFRTVSLENLKTFTIPFHFTFPFTGVVHGIAGWFDIDLGGFNLSTAPSAERTHWQQVRFLFVEPIAVNAYESFHGWMHLTVNDQRSYHISAEITRSDQPLLDPQSIHSEMVDSRQLAGATARRVGLWKLHEQTYYYENTAVDYSRPEFNGMYEPQEQS